MQVAKGGDRAAGGARVGDFDVQGELVDIRLRLNDLRSDGDRARGRWQVEIYIDIFLVLRIQVPNCSIARGNGLRVRGILDRQRPSGGLEDESLEWVCTYVEIVQSNHDAVVRVHAAAAVVFQFPVAIVARVAP